jgi:hypothetical protein
LPETIRRRRGEPTIPIQLFLSHRRAPSSESRPIIAGLTGYEALKNHDRRCQQNDGGFALPLESVFEAICFLSTSGCHSKQF